MATVPESRENVPIPLIDTGDLVALKEAYIPDFSDLHPTSRRAIRNLCLGHIAQNPQVLKSASESTRSQIETKDRGDLDLATLKQVPSLSRYFEFTHGTVVKIESRYFPTKIETEHATVMNNDQETRDGAARTVITQLYTDSGVLLTEARTPLQPEPVRVHIAQLNLLTKASGDWEESYNIDVAGAYAKHLGIEKPLDLCPNYGDE